MRRSDLVAALVAAAREVCGSDARLAICVLTDAARAIAGTCEAPEVELAHAIGKLQAARLQWIAAAAGGVRPFDGAVADEIDTAPYRRVEEG